MIFFPFILTGKYALNDIDAIFLNVKESEKWMRRQSYFFAYPGNSRCKINELDFELLCSSRDWKQGTKAQWRIMVEEEDESVSTHYSATILRLALPDCDCRWDCIPVMQEGVFSLKLHNFCIAAETYYSRKQISSFPLFRRKYKQKIFFVSKKFLAKYKQEFTIIHITFLYRYFVNSIIK